MLLSSLDEISSHVVDCTEFEELAVVTEPVSITYTVTCTCGKSWSVPCDNKHDVKRFAESANLFSGSFRRAAILEEERYFSEVVDPIFGVYLGE